MTLAADKAGVFASDAHRRVLGHLSHPDDEYGYTEQALAFRMAGDPALADDADLGAILGELESDGHAEQSPSGAWRMTQAGFDQITAPASNQGEDGPAIVEAHAVRAGAATSWGAEGGSDE